jgi:hypothetical protein
MPSFRTIKTTSDLVFLILFALVISLPLVSALSTEREGIARTEKRKTAEFPEIGLNAELLKTFPGRFESFYDDAFGFRKQLISMHHYVKVFLMKNSPSNRVVLGKNGWLFYNSNWDGDPIADYRNLTLFSEKSLERKVSTLVNREKWLSQRGIKYLYAIVPNKSSVYPEYMPDRFNQVNRLSLVDQFSGQISRNTDIAFLDLRSPLLAAKHKLPTYMRTGTHWTDYGAYVGGREVLAALRAWYPDIEPFRLDENSFTLMESPGDDLALMLGMDHIMIEDVPAGPKRKPDCGKRMPIETPRITRYWGKSFTIKCAGPNIHALVFRDSFSEKLVPLLSDRFGQVTYVWTRPTDKAFGWFVNKHKPDVVIEIHVERYLRSYP